jgi:hypothetical protein
MATSIEEKRRDVQAAFDAAFRHANEGEPGPLTGFEAALWTEVMAIGGALAALWLARCAARPRPARYEHEGRTYEVVGTEACEVGMRFGKIGYEGPVGRVVGWMRAARDLPLDRELGLCGGFSLLVVTTIVKLCAQMAFASARKTFLDIFAWSPSPRATLRMVDGLGAEARPFLDQAPPPEGDGEVLVVQVDGKGAPAISSREHARRRQPHRRPKSGATGTKRHERRARRRETPRSRRTPGKKSKNAKMAAVGVLYTLRKTPVGKLEGPINKRTYGTFESYRALFEWIRNEATKRGYGTAKFSKVLFVADGAEILWELQQEFFPDADVCLDWFHVVEKLWKTGRALHRKSRKRLEAWVAVQKCRLRRGQVQAVIDELRSILAATPRTGPGNKYRRKILSRTVEHFTKNAARMRYHALRRQDLDIGSGVAEGAVRHLVGVRLDGPGMRWGRDRMEAVLLLRCILINGQWDDFTRFLAAKNGVTLRSQPLPTRPHDAKPKLKKAA